MIIGQKVLSACKKSNTKHASDAAIKGQAKIVCHHIFKHKYNNKFIHHITTTAVAIKTRTIIPVFIWHIVKSYMPVAKLVITIFRFILKAITCELAKRKLQKKIKAERLKACLKSIIFHHFCSC